MKKNELKEKLHLLYNDKSKHAIYQNIPEFVKSALDYTEVINEDWRGDTARYRFLIDNINFKKKVVGDFGANTGFFSLSLAFENKDSKIIAYEMNKHHIDFMRMIKEYFDISNLTIMDKTLNMQGLDEIMEHDILLNFNVIHHAGVDFDTDMVSNIDNFNEYAKKYLKLVRKKTKQMVFQMGYNWGGNKRTPIVSPKNPIDFLVYLQDLVSQAGWAIEKVFLFDHVEKQYKTLKGEGMLFPASVTDLAEEINRLDFLNNSEFYKRPILVLKA